MEKRTWIIFIVLCVALFGGLVWFARKDAIDVSSVNTAQPVTSTDQNVIADHVYGNKDADVVFVEYGDYQCPGCGRAYAPVKRAVETTKKDVAFVFRNFPLVSAHPNAKAAAAAAESAGLQGKFWQMHDKLYEMQDDWSEASASERTAVFVGYARELGLDTEQFEKDMTSDKVGTKIATDTAMGRKQKVTGTPSFYINGETMDVYVKDGKVATASTTGAVQAWTDAESLENLVLRPAIRQAAKQ